VTLEELSELLQDIGAALARIVEQLDLLISYSLERGKK
jgi:hypothetical protein